MVICENGAAWMRALAPVDVPDRLYDCLVSVSSAVSGIESFYRVPYWTKARERITLNGKLSRLLKRRDALAGFGVDIAVVEEPLFPCLESVLESARITDRTEVDITKGSLRRGLHGELVSEFHGYGLVAAMTAVRTLDGAAVGVPVALITEYTGLCFEVTRRVCLAACQRSLARLATAKRELFTALECVVNLSVACASLWTSPARPVFWWRESFACIAGMVSRHWT